MKKILWVTGTLLLAGLLLAACQPAPPVDGPPVENGFEYGENAIIDSVEIMLLESFPVQAQVVVNGNLPDGCTELDDVSVERQEDTFNITLTTRRDPEMMCTQALVPFEEVISLDIDGLEAGTYTVNVQEQEASFTLDVDNVLD